jgi:hypothetical protein
MRNAVAFAAVVLAAPLATVDATSFSTHFRFFIRLLAGC